MEEKRFKVKKIEKYEEDLNIKNYTLFAKTVSFSITTIISIILLSQSCNQQYNLTLLTKFLAYSFGVANGFSSAFSLRDMIEAASDKVILKHKIDKLQIELNEEKHEEDHSKVKSKCKSI